MEEITADLDPYALDFPVCTFSLFLSLSHTHFVFMYVYVCVCVSLSILSNCITLIRATRVIRVIKIDFEPYALDFRSLNLYKQKNTINHVLAQEYSP